MTEKPKHAPAPPLPNPKLRLERERRAWSQSQLADKIGTTSLNISRWERGITQPGPHFRRQLADLFGLTPQQLGLIIDKSENPSTRGGLPAPAHMPGSGSSTAEPNALWHVAYRRNPFFTGREDILAQLRDAFITGTHQPTALAQLQAISGLGGIGKTQTAVEYAYRYREQYEAVFWARADSYDLLVSDFMLIANVLELPQRNEQEQDKIVQAVIRWFDTHSNWLLILDNADDLDIVRTFMPTAGKGHVLLTTRAQALGTLAQRIELEKMTTEEGILFLLRRIKRLRGDILPASTTESYRQAQAIVEVVDGLPLALDQAGAYIEETGCILTDYLKFYKTRRHRLLRARGKDATGHPEPVATTWSLSFEKVERANAAAAELLKLCAFLHPDAIPERMLTDGASQLGTLLGPIAADEFDLNEAIGELHKYSLVKRDTQEKIINIHRLVQMVIKDAMSREEEKAWAERVVKLLNDVFPEATNVELWPVCQRHLPHLQLCTEYIKHWHIIDTAAIHVLNRAGDYLRRRAQYHEATQFLQQALSLCQAFTNGERIETAHSKQNLAWVYLDVGKYPEAEPLYQEAQQLYEQLSGPEHPDTLSTINGLALLYREQGLFVQAEALLEKTLALRIKVLGLDHPDITESLNNLALVYGDLGKYAEAEPLLQQALALDEQRLGPEHPEIATYLTNIGWNYYRQGRYELVEAPHLRALAIREKALGLQHPYLGYNLNALGLLYRDLGHYAKAEAFLIRALQVREQALGPNHQEVAQCLQNLGALAIRRRKYEQAEAPLLRSLAIREQLGSDNPLVAYSLNPLGILYMHQGKYAEAEQLLHRAFTIREQAFGAESIDLAYTLEALAVLCHKQQRYDDALSFFQRTLSIQKKVLGDAHPYVAQTELEYAFLAIDQKDYKKARMLFQHVLAIQEQNFGPHHPDIAPALEGYALLLRTLQREEEATALEARAQTIRAQQE